MKILNFKNEIESHVKLLFPNSYVNVSLNKRLGQFISIDFRLIEKYEDQSNRIAHNDPLFTSLFISLPESKKFNIDDDLPEKFQIEMLHGYSLNVIPPENSYLAIGSVKTNWRNKTSRTELILKHVLKHFTNLRTIVFNEKEKGNIYNQKNIKEKYLTLGGF